MINYGKASPKVYLVPKLPNIIKDRIVQSFEVTAHGWDAIQNSPHFAPLLTDQVEDPMSDFAVCFPSKRKAYVDNYLTSTNISPFSSTVPILTWTPIDTTKGVPKSLREKGKYDTPYSPFYLPDNYPSNAGSYTGPKWEDKVIDQPPPNNDVVTIQTWIDWLTSLPSSGSTTSATTTAATTTLGPLPKLNCIAQTVVKDGLWWGVESCPFLNENMPFWVNITKEATPSSKDHETIIIISLGIGSDDQAFDLVIGNNRKPRIIDYYKGRSAYDEALTAVSGAVGSASGSETPPSNEREFEEELAKIYDTEKNIEIGFMTVAGRLVVFFNKNYIVYTRTKKETDPAKSGTLLEAKIAPGAIRIYGTNVKARIDVCPMVFAPASVMAFQIPLPPPNTAGPASTTLGGSNVYDYKNILKTGEIGDNSPARIPTENEPSTSVIPIGSSAAPTIKNSLWGIDCRRVYSAVTSDPDNPVGFGFHKLGNSWFYKANWFGLTASPDQSFYILWMQPEPVVVTFTGSSWLMHYGGCPYFFRLKGGVKPPFSNIPALPIDITPDVISISENFQAPDYFHVKKSASIVLYNKNGTYDTLRNQQYGIQIQWGWNGGGTQTFTGMTIKANTSEQPGSETIDVQCEDYMFILSNTPIINSPFYDGMVMFYAVKDLLNRAGIIDVVNDWDRTDDYFLPSGYGFTKPAVKFESKQMIFECIMFIVKRAEAFIYFDGYGRPHLKRLPGGLFSVGASELVTANFTRSPDTPGMTTILDEKNLESDLSSTVNRISIFTLDRDTRNAIVYGKPASGSEDHLLYRRIYLNDQAALGEYEAAVSWAADLAKRVFYPVRKTSFKVVGNSLVTMPLDFITVDGQEFRVMSISRKYDANSNDFSQEYNCEWLGG